MKITKKQALLIYATLVKGSANGLDADVYNLRSEIERYLTDDQSTHEDDAEESACGGECGHQNDDDEYSDDETEGDDDYLDDEDEDEEDVVPDPPGAFSTDAILASDLHNLPAVKCKSDRHTGVKSVEFNGADGGFSVLVDGYEEDNFCRLDRIYVTPDGFSVYDREALRWVTFRVKKFPNSWLKVFTRDEPTLYAVKLVNVFLTPRELLTVFEALIKDGREDDPATAKVRDSLTKSLDPALMNDRVKAEFDAWVNQQQRRIEELRDAEERRLAELRASEDVKRVPDERERYLRRRRTTNLLTGRN